MRQSPFISAMLFALLTNATSASAADQTPKIDYFLGESKMTTPSGQHIRTTLSLVKRVVNQAENRIEEHVMTIDEKGPAKAFVVTMDVKDSKYKMTEKSQAFTGEGELTGEPWKWTAWKSTSRLPGGAGTVTSEDKLTEHGLTAKKSFAGPDGKVQVQFDETLHRISAKTYEILAAKLTPAEKK